MVIANSIRNRLATHASRKQSCQAAKAANPNPRLRRAKSHLHFQRIAGARPCTAQRFEQERSEAQGQQDQEHVRGAALGGRPRGGNEPGQQGGDSNPKHGQGHLPGSARPSAAATSVAAEASTNRTNVSCRTRRDNSGAMPRLLPAAVQQQRDTFHRVNPQPGFAACRPAGWPRYRARCRTPPPSAQPSVADRPSRQTRPLARAESVVTITCRPSRKPRQAELVSVWASAAPVCRQCGPGRQARGATAAARRRRQDLLVPDGADLRSRFEPAFGQAKPRCGSPTRASYPVRCPAWTRGSASRTS